MWEGDYPGAATAFMRMPGEGVLIQIIIIVFKPYRVALREFSPVHLRN